MKYMLINYTEELEVAGGQSSDIQDVGGQGCDSISAVAVIDVNTPAAKTFDSGVAALLIEQDLTYTAQERGVAGNAITIEYIADGTAGAETVDVTGTSIVVHMDDTAVTGSTADDILAAIEASEAADALVSVAVSGTGADVQAAAAETPLATGVNSEVDLENSSVSIPAPGYYTGVKGRLTTTGTLPDGLALSTDYFIIVVDENTFQFAASLVDAEAGTAIELLDQGSSGAVNTFTLTALAGATVVFQTANNPEGPWVSIGSPTSITVDANLFIEKDRPTYRYIKALFAITAGQFSCDLQWLGKGDKA